MRSLEKIQKLSKIGEVVSRIAFILWAAGFLGCIAGIISLSLGRTVVLELTGGRYGSSVMAGCAQFSGRLFVCAGRAVLAKFAENYFKNELNAGTPFTLAQAKEMLRLGVITLIIPPACTIAGSIAEEITAGLMNIEKAAAMDIYFDNEPGFVLGIMLILISLLCHYGAELRESRDIPAE